jgi:hypothetical protein
MEKARMINGIRCSCMALHPLLWLGLHLSDVAKLYVPTPEWRQFGVVPKLESI